MQINLEIIGYIETPYMKLEDCPRNIDINGPECSLILGEMYKDGIMGLKAQDKILILYWLGDADRKVVTQTPFGNTEDLTGTFALRSPHRPNPIGAAVIQIKEITENIIIGKGLDCLNGTKLLDIKPAIKLELE